MKTVDADARDGGVRSSRRTHSKRAEPADRPGKGADGVFWELCLYVAGQGSKSITAIANLRHFCEEHLHGRYHIEIIDLAKNPELAQSDQILAIPTLVRKLPKPARKLIGDLSKTDKMLVGLDVSFSPAV